MNENKETLLEKIKSNKIVQKLKGVKRIEIIIALVVCVLAIGLYFCLGTSKSTNKKTSNFLSSSSSDESSDLEDIISQIKGVGKVRVLITSESSKGLTSQTDSDKIPSGVLGVIVVDEGASDAEVRVRILKAVQTATGVTVDKITIFEMG